MNILQRSLMTISCRDSDVIPKVPGAGGVVHRGPERVQVMHNGVEVVYGAYQGEWMSHVIRALEGHHEPQEELVFHVLLRYVRHSTRIVELGSFWAYYTQWYLKAIPDSVALCIEPVAHNLEVGRRNTALNGNVDRVRFIHASIGGEAVTWSENSVTPMPVPVLDAPSVLEAAGGVIELLHLDIQGAELPFLRSIAVDAARERLRFIMVSTHHSSISGSATTHGDCLEALRDLGATILIEHDVIESFSGDGLILASVLAEDRDLWFPAISRNRAETSLFKRA